MQLRKQEIRRLSLRRAVGPCKGHKRDFMVETYGMKSKVCNKTHIYNSILQFIINIMGVFYTPTATQVQGLLLATMLNVIRFSVMI